MSKLNALVFSPDILVTLSHKDFAKGLDPVLNAVMDIID
jgi:hypothetical protein